MNVLSLVAMAAALWLTLITVAVWLSFWAAILTLFAIALTFVMVAGWLDARQARQDAERAAELAIGNEMEAGVRAAADDAADDVHYGNGKRPYQRRKP